MTSRIKDGHIGYREVGATLTVMLTTKIFLSCPRAPIVEGHTAGWMIPLVGAIIALIGMWPLIYLMQREPDHNLIQMAEDHGGPVAGLFIGIVMSCYFLVAIVMIVRQFTETVIVALLPTTPISVITILFLMGMMYAAYQGIESLTRTAWLLMPFILLGMIGVLLLTFPRADFDRMFPIWGVGLKKIMAFGLLRSSLYSEILIMGMLNPMIRERDKIKPLMITVLSFSGILFALTILVYVLVFDLPAAISSGTYPLYNLARLIDYGRFVQRVESIFIFIWVFSMLVNMATLFYGLCISLASTLKVPIYQPLIFPLAVLIYALVFMIPNFPYAVWLDTKVLHEYSFLVSISIPVLVVFLVKLKPKRGGAGRAQKAS